MIRGTATYKFKNGSQDKLDFKLIFKSSKFMNPESEGLNELLTQGALQHSSSVTKSTSLTFNQLLSKLSSALNFAVVEQVENTAFIFGKTMKSQHSVAFFIKQNGPNSYLMDGKATNPSILAALTEEIRDMDL